jgi:hypothetical protein
MQALRASISDLKSAHVSAASAVGERDVPSPVEPTLLIHALLALAEPTERVSQPSPSTLAVLAWPFFLRLASQLMAKLLADSKQAESNQRDKVIPLRCRGARAQRTSLGMRAMRSLPAESAERAGGARQRQWGLEQ